MEYPVRQLRRSDAAHGLTLVELLVTIMIIGILSSSVLFAMSVAQESARKSRTQAVIATLHSLVIEKWESYLTRRINFDISVQYAATGARAASAIRLKQVRQMLKMDFPDQWGDVEYLTQNNDSAVANNQTYLSLSIWSAWWVAVNQTIPGLASITTLPVADRPAASKILLELNESSECLYSIIEFARGTADRFKLLDSSYIGDTDLDGLPEFLDGWGRPIAFRRWPTGFSSDLQNGKPGTVTSLTGADNDSGALDHDPFDPYRWEPHAFRTVPLIVSAGPDGELDVAYYRLNYAGPSALDMNNRWNPYYLKDGRRPGEACDCNVNASGNLVGNGIEEWHDNIHNHLITGR